MKNRQIAALTRGHQRANCGGMAVAWPGPISTPTVLSDEIHYRILRLLEAQPDISQRQIAKELGVSPEEGRQTLQALFKSGVYGWMYPNTDFIASYAPFNNQPTQFRVTVEGEQKWFAQ